VSIAELARKPIPPETNAATYLRRAVDESNAIEKAVSDAVDAAPEPDQNAFHDKLLASPEILQAIQQAFDANPHAIPLLERAARSAGHWLAVAEGAIAGGADCLQLREKSLDGGELLTRTKKLVAMARPRGVAVIVNDRPDIALLGEADGVHLGQTDLPCAEARRLVGRRLLIGVSTSNLFQARQALSDGADYCGVGPMFATTTKHKEHIVGQDYLREYVAWGKLPHLAIGGITVERVGELLRAGGRGIAVSSVICGAVDPAAVTRELLKAMSAV